MPPEAADASALAPSERQFFVKRSYAFQTDAAAQDGSRSS